MNRSASRSQALTPQQKLIFDLAESGRGSVDVLDVGRGELRRSCLGIVTENVDACLERAAARGLRGARFAQIGLRGVVYWPDVPAPRSISH